jgi:hypothetical protein
MIRKLTGLFSLALLVACPCQHAFRSQPFELNRGANRIEVLVGGRPFTVYYSDPDLAKPYERD